MKKVSLALSVLFVVALSSMASANSYNVQTSNGAGCSQNEDTGRTMQFGTSINTATNEGTLSATYTIQLGKKKLRKVDCNRLYDISIKRQEIQLEREQLELELLRTQIANTKSQNSNQITLGDDW
jgi:hypothetical protein